MTEFQRICLVHYHEIGLKGHNRSTFEMRLLKNLEALLKPFPVVVIHRIAGRLCVFLREGTDWTTAKEAADVIGKVPGVARVSCGFKCERDLDEMTEAALAAMAEAGEFDTFKVAARRNHTDFVTGSMDMNQIIGSALCAAHPEKSVKMKKPDVTVGVEVVQNAAYVYARSLPGVGGLPVGSSGLVVSLLSSGIDSPVATWKCERDLDEMTEAALAAMAEAGEFDTFKVAARRNHTDFVTGSMDMNQIIGSALCAAHPEKSVKMKKPDVTVGVEVVQNAAYVYARSLPGVGGLPVGSSGLVVSLLSSGIDSPVATWKLARRGAVCIGVHFSGRPQTSDASEYLVDDIAQVLERTGCIARVYAVPFGDYQREIALTVPPELRVIMYRRLMFKVAEEIARRERAGALVTGESLGQVASQTLDNIRCTDAAVDLPVFRPLIGTDKLEIIAEAERLGSFEISSQDAPDCCTLFMPRSPETHAKLPVVLEAEAALPIERWVPEIADAAEVRDYACPAYKPKKKRAS